MFLSRERRNKTMKNLLSQTISSHTIPHKSHHVCPYLHNTAHKPNTHTAHSRAHLCRNTTITPRHQELLWMHVLIHQYRSMTLIPTTRGSYCASWLLWRVDYRLHWQHCTVSHDTHCTGLSHHIKHYIRVKQTDSLVMHAKGCSCYIDHSIRTNH